MHLFTFLTVWFTRAASVSFFTVYAFWAKARSIATCTAFYTSAFIMIDTASTWSCATFMTAVTRHSIAVIATFALVINNWGSAYFAAGAYRKRHLAPSTTEAFEPFFITEVTTRAFTLQAEFISTLFACTTLTCSIMLHTSLTWKMSTVEWTFITDNALCTYTVMNRALAGTTISPLAIV